MCEVVLQAGVYNISGSPFSTVFQFNNVRGLSITECRTVSYASYDAASVHIIYCRVVR